MSATYIISKSLDPIFAVSVGFAAAAVRIRREEHAKGNQEIIETLKRRVNLVVGDASDDGKNTVHVKDALSQKS